jgi:hypothetical protein
VEIALTIVVTFVCAVGISYWWYRRGFDDATKIWLQRLDMIALQISQEQERFKSRLVNGDEFLQWLNQLAGFGIHSKGE